MRVSNSIDSEEEICINMGTTNSRRTEAGRGGCSNSGGVGRLSLRRILLHSPLLGHRLRFAAHRVVEGRHGSGRIGSVATPASVPPRINSIRPSTPAHLPGHDNISEEEEDVMECPLCLGVFDADNFPVLCTCSHRSCCHCLRRYLSIEIQESRVCIACPECSEPMHPSDIKRILDNEFIYEKYEDFMVRRVLAADPDTRWCPAPDCNFAVVAQGCASCPELWCQAPGCGKAFCYHCKAAWHPNQTCDAARRQRSPPSVPSAAPPPQAHQSPTESFSGLVKPCPRCSVLIVKIEDGSCNHMVCCVCGSEFCWLCMKEISDLHYLSPSGCTFWGKAPWSRKKKLLWQLGTLAGAPLGIALLAGVAAPALLLGLPVWAGRRAQARCRKMPPAKRRALVVAAVAAAMLAAPAIATIAVGIGVPILLFYVYGVVPVSLCRSGGCGLSTSPRGGVRIDIDEDDDIPTRVSDGGSIAGGGGSTSGAGDLRGKLGAGGSPSSGGARSTTPAHTGSIASQDRFHGAHRLEVTADVVSALRLSLSSEAASLSEPLPPDDASTRALAGSIRDYKQNQSETVSYSAADDCASERVRFDDNVSIIGPSSNADFLPDTLTDKHSICSSRSFRSLGKSSITEELSESLDKSSIGSGPRNVIFEENLDDINNIQESPNSHKSNSQSSLPGARRTIPKLTLKTNHKHFTSFEEDVTSQTPPDVVKFLERNDKVINLINKQNKNSFDRVVCTSYIDTASVQNVSDVETPETPVNESDASKPIVTMRDNGCKYSERDLECGSDIPKRPLSKVAMLRNIFFHGSSMVDDTEMPVDLAKPSTSENCNSFLTLKNFNVGIESTNNDLSSIRVREDKLLCEKETYLWDEKNESKCRFVKSETPIDLAKPSTSEHCNSLLTIKNDNIVIELTDNDLSSMDKQEDKLLCEKDEKDESQCRFVENETTNT